MQLNLAGRPAIAGYALLEAMIAVLVAAVGFIGAARMQTLGMSLGNSAQSRQKATLLAYQMTDRIRANKDGSTNGDGSIKSFYLNPSAPASDAAGCLSTSTGCNSTQLAAADLREWLNEVAAQLPGGLGQVCIDSTPNDVDATPADPKCDGLGNIIAVKIWWTDNVGSTATRFVTMVRP